MTSVPPALHAHSVSPAPAAAHQRPAATTSKVNVEIFATSPVTVTLHHTVIECLPSLSSSSTLSLAFPSLSKAPVVVNYHPLCVCHCSYPSVTVISLPPFLPLSFPPFHLLSLYSDSHLTPNDSTLQAPFFFCI